MGLDKFSELIWPLLNLVTVDLDGRWLSNTSPSGEELKTAF